jgi:hypothetical protein
MSLAVDFSMLFDDLLSISAEIEIISPELNRFCKDEKIIFITKQSSFLNKCGQFQHKIEIISLLSKKLTRFLIR